MPRRCRIPERRASVLRGSLRAGLLGLVLGALGCGPPAPEASLELEFAGCLHVTEPVERPVCVLDEADPDLRLWVRSPREGPIEVRAGAQSWHSSGAEPIQGGYLFRLEDVDASEVVVRAAGLRRSLHVRYRSAEERREEECREQERREEAARQEEQIPEPAILAAGARAQGGRGHRSRQLIELLNLHYHLYHQHDRPEEAGRILADLPEPPRGDGSSASSVAYYRGSWAARTGRFLSALSELRKARRQAERLQLDRIISPAEQDLLHVLVRLGRFEQARELLARLYQRAEAGELPACELSDLWTDIGWSELLMLEAGLDIDPIPALRRARETLLQCEGRTDTKAWNVEINLALAALAMGRLEACRRHLAASRGLDPESWWSTSWQREAEARLALAEGDPRGAEQLFRALREHPAAHLNAGLRRRATIGIARALEARGQVDTALELYGEAERLAFRASLSIPFDESGVGQLFQNETRYYLELLIALGRLDQALEVARRSLARNLGRLSFSTRLEEMSPELRDRWDSLVNVYWTLTSQIHELSRDAELAPADRVRELGRERARLEERATDAFDRALGLLDEATRDPDAELPPLRPDELLLVYHPSSRGWIGLAADDRGVTAGWVDQQDPDPAKWIDPFREAIRRAEKIRILPYGKLWQLSFQTLPFAGEDLLRHAQVVYGLDLPPLERREEGGTPPRILLAAEPDGTLPHARAELETIEQLLRRREPPWQVTTATDLGEVRSLLEGGPDLFHFAGHGELVGWEATSGLVFEQGFGESVRLTIRDTLAFDSVPETVVLSACESTLPVSLEEPSSLGIGHAFLLAGSHRVVGSLEKIEDAEARAAMERFYEELRDTGSAAEALRAVQLAPGALPEWKKLRVVER